MHVTIERREVKRGLLRNRTGYEVILTVVFSEEEKAVIKSRNLTKHWIYEWVDTQHGPQGVSVNRLITKGKYEYPADDMTDALAWENQIRDSLPRFKALIDVNKADSNKTDSFEL
jgi:hypothetical protein